MVPLRLSMVVALSSWNGLDSWCGSVQKALKVVNCCMTLWVDLRRGQMPYLVGNLDIWRSLGMGSLVGKSSTAGGGGGGLHV